MPKYGRKKRNPAGGSHPTSRPQFNSRDRTQRFWGGDGTVICPDSVRVMLPYETILSPTTTLGSLFSYQFRGNSVFDPDSTGVGGQPNGFDQWAAFYNEYVVLSSTIVVEIICGTVTANEYVIYPSYNSGVPASTQEGSGYRYARRRIGILSGNAVRGVLASSMSTAELAGVKTEAIIDDDAYGATVSANPAATAVWYWTVLAQNLSTTTLADRLRVRIVYDVMFRDPIQLGLSSVRARNGPRPQLEFETLSSGALAALMPTCDRSAAAECETERQLSDAVGFDHSADALVACAASRLKLDPLKSVNAASPLGATPESAPPGQNAGDLPGNCEVCGRVHGSGRGAIRRV